LSVLRTEIEDDTCLGVHASVWQEARSDCKLRMLGFYTMQHQSYGSWRASSFGVPMVRAGTFFRLR
jgi:hypothetical protein